MRAGLALLLLIIGASPAAAACQHGEILRVSLGKCVSVKSPLALRYVHHATRYVARVPLQPHAPPHWPVTPPARIMWLPLPALDDIEWGQAAQLDSETFGRLLLRAKMEH